MNELRPSVKKAVGILYNLSACDAISAGADQTSAALYGRAVARIADLRTVEGFLKNDIQDRKYLDESSFQLGSEGSVLLAQMDVKRGASAARGEIQAQALLDQLSEIAKSDSDFMYPLDSAPINTITATRSLVFEALKVVAENPAIKQEPFLELLGFLQEHGLVTPARIDEISLSKFEEREWKNDIDAIPEPIQDIGSDARGQAFGTRDRGSETGTADRGNHNLQMGPSSYEFGPGFGRA